MFTHRKRPPCPYDIAQLGSTPLDFAPGERSAYSNLGYCLLGVILERVSGEPYRAYMNREYALEAAGIQFVDGDYFADEVTYDFRNSNHYGASYSKYFDLPAVSSSAGLSGSAAALARAVRPMVLRQSFGLTSATMPPDCNPAALRSCYGYAFFTVQSADGRLRLHVQPGLLYGVSALVIADSEGGVVVWLGNGMPRAEDVVGNDMIRYLSDALSDHYARRSQVHAQNAL
jgi:D-alanyl-D-alanine carboxypeptidase